MPSINHRPPDRRAFLRSTTAAAGAALSLSAGSYAAVPGSNARIRVAFLGCGARAQAHLHLVLRLAGEGVPVVPAAVCDVWDGLDEEYDQPTATGAVRRRYSQGLFPSAVRCGLDPADRTRVMKDYRRVLDLPDVDAVCVATPDHWHARMTLDALAAGKHVLCETPLARTPAESAAVAEAAGRANRVVAVASQNLADPNWRLARDRIAAGDLGPVTHLSAGVFRSDPRGHWRFLRAVPQMTQQAIDWDLFLGHRFEVGGEPLGPPPADAPFDRGLFAQWRCDQRFSGGPFTDFLVHPVTRLLAAAGVRGPARVAGAGGLYLERDGRDVPDVATLLADFPGGCHLVVTGSTTSAHPQPEVVRGRRGALELAKGGVRVLAGGTFPEATADAPRNETEAVWRDFVACCETRGRLPLCPAELGATAAAMVALAQRSLRDGRTHAWEPAAG